ncbi:GNAT family N-acetyltransferase [Pseudogracilibacillus sp. SE30717A]|uniref:GNAT family N-acetyltransferase n=1 Tax=Pseudogracilibacillus sp. SE30717A TaxID=3098293 RepID=UPI00300DFC07
MREMKDSEREIVRELLMVSYGEYKESFTNERWGKYQEEIKASVDNERIDAIYVAIFQKEIVGTMQLFCSASEAYQLPGLEIDAPIIRFLAVRPNVRGLGVARKLLDQAISYAKNKHVNAIYLHTTKAMSGAIRLYEKYGFIRDDSKDYIKNGNQIQCYSFKMREGEKR